MSKEKISKIKKISTINFRPKEHRESKYAHVFEEMMKLKGGQCFEITMAKDVPPATYIRRLNAFLKTRKPYLIPNGCVFKKRVTEEGNVAVCCVERKGR